MTAGTYNEMIERLRTLLKLIEVEVDEGWGDVAREGIELVDRLKQTGPEERSPGPHHKSNASAS